MTDIRSNAYTARKSEKPAMASVAIALKSFARWIGILTCGLLKILILIPSNVGRAFEMAYVDPFANLSSRRDHERR